MLPAFTDSSTAEKLFLLRLLADCAGLRRISESYPPGSNLSSAGFLIKEIRTIEQEKPGIWIVENAGYPLINIPVLAGAPTINSTNVYPNLEHWSQLDPEGSNEEIYNRYAIF